VFHEGKYSKLLFIVVLLMAGTWHGHHVEEEGETGLQKSMVGLLAMVVLVGMGEKMGERFLPIYLITLGGGALSVGLLSGMDNLLSALYSFPGGYLADRLGTKRALLVFNLIAMVGFVVVILIPAWQAVIVGSVFFLSWTAISLPATMGLVAQVLPHNRRTMGVTMHSLVRRFPMALGPLVGGVCIDIWGRVTGIRIAFIGALAMAVVAAIMQQILIREGASDQEAQATKSQAEKNPFRLLREMTGAPSQGHNVGAVCGVPEPTLSTGIGRRGRSQ